MLLNYIVRVERHKPPPGWDVSDMSPNSFRVDSTYMATLPREVAAKVAMLDLTLEVPSGYVSQMGWRLTPDVYWVETEGEFSVSHCETKLSHTAREE